MAKVPDLSTYGAELALTTVSGVTRILIRPTQPKWRKDLADRFRPTGWLAWSNVHEGFVATRALRFGDLKVLFPNIQLVEGKIASAPAEAAAAPEPAVEAAERAEGEVVATEGESSAAPPEARVEGPAAAPAAIGDAPADEAIEVSGYRVYPTQVRRPQGVETMWALESVDNQERRAKGLPTGIGDALFETLALASQGAELQARQQAERIARAEREEQARQREAEAAAAAKADTVNGFVDGKLPMQVARMKEALGKQLRFDGVVMTVRERVESLHAAGKLTVETFEEPRVKPMSRLAFFRATQAEQSAHERRMREAGTRTEYLVNDSVLGKTAYDYAQHLLGSAGVKDRDLDSESDNADAEQPTAAAEASAPLDEQAAEPVSAADDVAANATEDALKVRAKALASRSAS